MQSRKATRPVVRPPDPPAGCSPDPSLPRQSATATEFNAQAMNSSGRNGREM